MRFGGWSLGGSAQNISLYTTTPTVDDERTREATYQEFHLISGTAKRGVGEFPCCYDPRGWPYVDFTVVLLRAEKHYDIKIIAMNILLTYLSFAVFLLDCKTGERLQFSITVLLTVVAADHLVTGVVPVCRPVLWIELFFIACWGFCTLSIIANIIVHWFYYKAPPEVYASGLPRLSLLQSWLSQKLSRRGDAEVVWAEEDRARPSMWRGDSALSDADPSRADASSAGGGRGAVERSAPLPQRLSSVDLRRRASLRRQHTNPHLEPNSPKFRRMSSSRRADARRCSIGLPRSPLSINEMRPASTESLVAVKEHEGDPPAPAAVTGHVSFDDSAEKSPMAAAQEDADAAAAVDVGTRERRRTTHFQSMRVRLRSIASFGRPGRSDSHGRHKAHSIVPFEGAFVEAERLGHLADAARERAAEAGHGGCAFGITGLCTFKVGTRARTTAHSSELKFEGLLYHYKSYVPCFFDSRPIRASVY